MLQEAERRWREGSRREGSVWLPSPHAPLSRVTGPSKGTGSEAYRRLLRLLRFDFLTFRLFLTLPFSTSNT